MKFSFFAGRLGSLGFREVGRLFRARQLDALGEAELPGPTPGCALHCLESGDLGVPNRVWNVPVDGPEAGSEVPDERAATRP